MSDRKLTLLELHFDEGFQIGPKTVGIGGSDDDGDDEASEEEIGDTTGADADNDRDGDRDGDARRALLVAVLALAVAAAVARRLRDDDPVEIETPDETEDVEEIESAD